MLTRPSLLRFTGLLFALWCGSLHAEPFRDCDVCPEMVVVPAGKFMMGSPQSEEGLPNEWPRHRVRIATPFAVGRFEVTFAEWDACAADGGCGEYRPYDMGWGRGRRPVIYVSWYDAQSYVRWLSRKTGKSYRLLSEAEWEYAARAGTTTAFHFGSDISTDQANFKPVPNSADHGTVLFRQKTVHAGSFPANGFGLYDMHGNVSEWVEDCVNDKTFDDAYKGAPADGSAWVWNQCSARILRGGAWDSYPWEIRSAYRSGHHAVWPDESSGFRVARDL